jgi:hypothetical protein
MELKTGFMYIGTSAERLDLALPYPSTGGAGFEKETMYEQTRNANGVLVGQQLGKPVVRQDISWDRIGPTQWYAVMRFFEENGDAFYARYYDYSAGGWVTKRFVKSAVHANPMRVDPATGRPAYFADAGFSIESIGE